ncbi:hypothetical protein HanIR_Chr14g0672981 [Helianthus annuus]|nr:hypothetical protein HanIR_Chr14g0672981 [Helianthus annuus]
MVTVVYSNGEEDTFTMDQVLNTENVHFLDKLCDLTPSNIITNKIVIMFKSRMRGRLNQLKALNDNVVDDDEFRESDE